MPPAGKVHIRMRPKRREESKSSRSRATTETSVERSSSGTSLSTMPLSASPSGSGPSPIKVMVASRSDIAKMTEEAVRDALRSRYDDMSDRLDSRLESISREMTSARAERERVEQENEQLKEQLSEAVAWIAESEDRHEEQHKPIHMSSRSKRRHKSRDDEDRERERAHLNQPETHVHRRQQSPKQKRSSRERPKTGRSSPQRASRSCERPRTAEARVRRWRAKSSVTSADDEKRRRSVSPEERRTSGSAPTQVRLTRRKRLPPNGLHADHSASDSGSESCSDDPDRREHNREKKYVDNHKWPEDSPPAGVYDVRNTSAKMVIYNNRRPSTSNRLRGYSDQTLPREPSPKRHLPNLTNKKNPERHSQCNSSGSQRPDIDPNMPGYWLNQAARPQSQDEGDPNGRHAGCYLDNEMLKFLHLHGPVRAKQVLARAVPDDVSNNEYRFLRHPELTPGERRYLSSVASVYNMTQMKQMKQAQYRSLLKKQLRLGFASASEYEKYVRYLEGPRMVTPGAKEEGQKGSSKKSDALLARRRAAQEGKTSKQDQKNKASPYDEDLAEPVREEKDTPGGSRRRGGRRRRQEAEGAERDDGHRRPTSAREVWGDDDDTVSETRRRSARKSEFAFLQAVTAEADREDARRHAARHDVRMSVDSISSAGSSHDPQPHPPHTPREGYGRPRSRLGRKKPKQEDIEDEDNIPEDYDTNHDNSLLVVVEGDSQPNITPVPIRRKEEPPAETRGTQTGDEEEEEVDSQPLSKPMDVGTSISDFEAYLKAAAAAEQKERAETCETGTSMAEERAARRERRRRRREERQRQAEEHRRLNMSVEESVAAAAAVGAETDGGKSELEDDGTSSVFSRETGLSQVTVSPEPDAASIQASSSAEKSPNEVVTGEEAAPKDEPKIEETPQEVTEKSENEDVEQVIPLLKDDADQAQEQKTEEKKSEEEGAAIENVQVTESAPEVQDQNVEQLTEQNATPYNKDNKDIDVNDKLTTDPQQTTGETEAILDQQVQTEEQSKPLDTSSEQKQIDPQSADSESPVGIPEPNQESTEQPIIAVSGSLEGSKTDLGGVGSTEDMYDLGDDVSMDVRFEENPPDPVSTSVGGVEGAIFSPIIPTPRPIDTDRETVLSDTDSPEVLSKDIDSTKNDQPAPDVINNEQSTLVDKVKETTEDVAVAVAESDDVNKQEQLAQEEQEKGEGKVVDDNTNVAVESGSKVGNENEGNECVENVRAETNIEGDNGDVVKGIQQEDLVYDSEIGKASQSTSQNIEDTVIDVPKETQTEDGQAITTEEGTDLDKAASTDASERITEMVAEGSKENTKVEEPDNQSNDAQESKAEADDVQQGQTDDTSLAQTATEGGISISSDKIEKEITKIEDKELGQREMAKDESKVAEGDMTSSEEKHENNETATESNVTEKDVEDKVEDSQSIQGEIKEPINEGTTEIHVEVNKDETNTPSEEVSNAVNETGQDEAERQAAKILVEECLKNALDEVSKDTPEDSQPVSEPDDHVERATVEVEQAKTETKEENLPDSDLPKENIETTPNETVIQSNETVEQDANDQLSQNLQTDVATLQVKLDSMKESEKNTPEENDKNKEIDSNIEITQSTSSDSLEPNVSINEIDVKQNEGSDETNAENMDALETVKDKSDETVKEGRDVSPEIDSAVETNVDEKQEEESTVDTKQNESDNRDNVSEEKAIQKDTENLEQADQPTDSTTVTESPEHQSSSEQNDEKQGQTPRVQSTEDVSQEIVKNDQTNAAPEEAEVKQTPKVSSAPSDAEDQGANEANMQENETQPAASNEGRINENETQNSQGNESQGEEKEAMDGKDNVNIGTGTEEANENDGTKNSQEAVEDVRENNAVSSQETQEKTSSNAIGDASPDFPQNHEQISEETFEKNETIKEQAEQQVEEASTNSVVKDNEINAKGSEENNEINDHQLETSEANKDIQEDATENTSVVGENEAIGTEQPTKSTIQLMDRRAVGDTQQQEPEPNILTATGESSVKPEEDSEVKEEIVQKDSSEEKQQIENSSEKTSLSIPESSTPTVEDEPRDKDSYQEQSSNDKDTTIDLLAHPAASPVRRPSITVNSPDGNLIEELLQTDNSQDNQEGKPDNNTEGLTQDTLHTNKDIENTPDNDKIVGDEGIEEKPSGKAHVPEQVTTGQENVVNEVPEEVTTGQENVVNGVTEQVTTGQENVVNEVPEEVTTGQENVVNGVTEQVTTGQENVVNEVPEEVTTGQENVVNEVPEQVTTGQENVVNGVPEQVTTGQENVMNEVPEQVTTGQENVVNGVPEQVTTGQENVVNGVPEQVTTGQENVVNGVPKQVNTSQENVVNGADQVVEASENSSQDITEKTDKEQLPNGSPDSEPTAPKPHVPIIKSPMFVDQPKGSDLKLKMKGKLDSGKQVTYTLTGSGVSKALTGEKGSENTNNSEPNINSTIPENTMQYEAEGNKEISTEGAD